MSTTTQGGDRAVDGRYWRGPQVCTLAEITYRQLDHWARTGSLRPSIAEARGSGTQRLYSTADVIAAAVVRELSAHGAHSHAVAAAVDRLTSTPPDRWSGLLAVTHDGLVLDLAELLLDDSSPLLGCWLVNLSAIVESVHERMSVLA